MQTTATKWMSTPVAKQGLQDYYAACSALVSRIRSGDSGAMGELYGAFCDRTSGYLRQRLGNQDITDLTHDVFLVVVEAIRRNQLDDPTRLMGFVKTVLQRKIAAHLRATIRRRNFEQDITEYSVVDSGMRADQVVESRERTQIMRRVFSTLSQREREILERFYLEEQSEVQIRQEMKLTGTNYRVLKSRAKAKFGSTGRHWLHSSRMRQR